MNTDQEEVRSLARGLAVLRELNRAGSARVSAITQQLGLARTTVHRLLETLEASGFAVKSASDERYRITRRAAGFFDRYAASHGIDRSLQAAFSHEGRLCPWLLHIATFQHGRMIIRATNRSQICVVPWRGYVGTHLSLLHSAAGRAYLASFGDGQRREIVRQCDTTERDTLDDAAINDLVAGISPLGVAEYGHDPLDPLAENMSIALKLERAVIGSLTLVYNRPVSTRSIPSSQLVATLRGEADHIAKYLSSSSAVLGESNDQSCA